MKIPPHQLLSRIVFCLFCLPPLTVYANGDSNVYELSTSNSLAGILEDLEFALTERNLRIVERLHIGQAIQSRGKKNFPDYEVIMYCSLTFVEKILALDPALINACPGRITVRGGANAYIISAPLWPEQNGNPALDELMQHMNLMIHEIVDYAAAGWTETNAP